MRTLLLAVLVGSVYGQSLPIEPPHETGTSITGAYEGWFKNPDGSFSLLLGYYNRNMKQELAIPIGPNNRIEPGGPDRGQPTFFLPGRQWGMFRVQVPSNFGESKLTWTLGANGITTAIPISLKPDYEVSPFGEAAGNMPPALAFDEGSASVQGPAGLTSTRTAKVGQPLPLSVWVADDLKAPSGSGAVSKRIAAHPVTVTWSKFRGPGEVVFTNIKPEVQKLETTNPHFAFSGLAETKATFQTPGEYVLHVYANDYSGEGGAGFECCWTYGDVKVTVQP
jgi:hypothetical protein